MKRVAMRAAWAWMMAASLWAAAIPVYAEDDEDGATGEALLPKEVLVYFSLPSIPELKERLDGSLSGDMLQDPEFQPFMDGVKAKIEEASAKMKEEVGVTVDDLLAIPQGEITFAVIELPPRKLAMVLLLDYGDSRDTIDTLIGKMEEGLKESGGEVEGEEVGEVNIRTFTFEQEGENPFNKLAYFDHDNYLAFASDPEALKAVLERWDGKSEETFASHEIFGYIIDQCTTDGRDPLMKWYVNPIGLTQSAISLMQAQVPQAGLVLGFLPVLGLDKLKAMGGASDIAVDDFDAVYKSFFYVEQPTSGVLNVFQFPATDLAPPKWVPADVTVYSAMNWNVSGAYTAIETLVDSFQGPGALGKLIDQLAENDEGPQVHLKKDVIDQLTGQIHIVIGATDEEADPNPENVEQATPKMIFALDVKNAAKLNAVLVKAAKSEGFQGKTRDFEGITIYEMENPGGGGASLAVADKHLMIATDDALLENALRPSSDTAPLSADAVYKTVSKKFPKKVSMLGFQNGNSQLQTLYQMVKAGTVPDMPEEFRELTMKLPEYESLKKYLRASGGYTVPDKEGALSVSFTLKDQE